MSGMALIWAANVKGLKPAAKIVLIQLADFHNKETGQCNPSAQRLADECEMGRATLFRHMTTLEECGLVTRHARGDGDGGRGSNQYELHIDITLGPSSRSKGGGSGPNGVASQNETGGNVSIKRGKSLKGETGVVSNRDTNLTIEPKKEPPSRERETGEAEKILAAYPPDRLRGTAACLAQIEEAMKEGIAPVDLLQAVKAYATDSAGFTPHHQFLKTSPCYFGFVAFVRNSQRNVRLTFAEVTSGKDRNALSTRPTHQAQCIPLML